jgi:hypothetical protein
MKYLVVINLVFAIINLVNGIVMERIDCLMVALFNLACAYLIDKQK